MNLNLYENQFFETDIVVSIPIRDLMNLNLKILLPMGSGKRSFNPY